MTLRPIVQLDNPVLRKRAIKVTSFGPDFQTLVDDMVETMIDAPGVGLAAPQVNVSQRLIVVRLPDDEESREEYGDQAGVLYVFANPEIIAQLAASGQIATQYCDPDGVPSMDITINPNGSLAAIEGITSPCGRVFGKMAHSERLLGKDLYKNIPGDRDQKIFAAGVRYFK